MHCLQEKLLISDIKTLVQVSEMVLYAYLVIYVISEVREIMAEPAPTVSAKFRYHFSRTFNQYDLILIVFATITVILKFIWATFWVRIDERNLVPSYISEPIFQISRILFAFNFSFVCVNLFRYYHSSIGLGPKLVIINRCCRIIPLKIKVYQVLFAKG